MDILDSLIRMDGGRSVRIGAVLVTLSGLSAIAAWLWPRLAPCANTSRLTDGEKAALERWRKKVDRRSLLPSLLILPAFPAVFYGLLALQAYHVAAMPKSFGVSVFDTTAGQHIVWGLCTLAIVTAFFTVAGRVLIRLFAGGQRLRAYHLAHNVAKGRRYDYLLVRSWVAVVLLPLALIFVAVRLDWYVRVEEDRVVVNELFSLTETAYRYDEVTVDVSMPRSRYWLGKEDTLFHTRVTFADGDEVTFEAGAGMHKAMVELRQRATARRHNFWSSKAR